MDLRVPHGLIGADPIAAAHDTIRATVYVNHRSRIPDLSGAGVLGWMYLQPDRNRGDGSTVSPAAGRLLYEAPTMLAGFRPDAWFLPDDALLGFVAIPAGPFQMGGDITTDPMSFENEQWAADQAQGTVELPLFYIGRFEVTVAQFAAFVGDTGHRVSDEALRSPPDHPVSAVSWPDALAYCRWLEMVFLESDDTPEPIRRLLRAGGHVTLPSEAEWEESGAGNGRTGISLGG